MARVLIVDDEPRIRDLIREHLQYAGFTCAEAGDGTQALAELANGGIDLVILDIMMPVLDGLGALEKIIAYDENAHAVMVTAAGQKSKMVDAIKLGANEFVQKPFEPDQILSVIGNITK